MVPDLPLVRDLPRGENTLTPRPPLQNLERGSMNFPPVEGCPQGKVVLMA